jgi:hypothetical protein
MTLATPDPSGGDLQLFAADTEQGLAMWALGKHGWFCLGVVEVRKTLAKMIA